MLSRHNAGRRTPSVIYTSITSESFRKIILLMSFDNKGAFNNAKSPPLKAQLLAYKYSVNLSSIAQGYLRDQEIAGWKLEQSVGGTLPKVVYRAL
ncbi:hypothetical protein EVAR_7087_1 [Eumeta japonica]|uniref:Uncharacterized protein n=1 Tax=Eumeta variegata TaxID=151549 RepID=A0A4C1Y931_EUMVA|nr:hypothetical protein EVAR_7087_1 [Eumeta japonica]